MNRLDRLLEQKVEEKFDFGIKDLSIILLLGLVFNIGIFSYFRQNSTEIFSTNLRLASISFTIAALVIVFVKEDYSSNKVKKHISTTAESFINSGIVFLTFGAVYPILNDNQALIQKYGLSEPILFGTMAFYMLGTFFFSLGIFGLRKMAGNLDGIKLVKK